MEDRGCKHGGGTAVADPFDEVLQRTDSARSDHRYRYRIGDGAGERDVEPLLRAVAIHRRQQDLAGAERGYLARIIDRIEARGIAASVGEDFPALAFPRLRYALGIDRDDDTLISEFFRRLLHEGASGHGRGVDRYLIGPGGQKLTDVLDRAHTAADGERHKARLGRALDYVEDDVTVLVTGGDIQEREFVGAGRVIGDRRRDRIAGIAQVEKFHAFDDAAVLDVETGDDANLEHVLTWSHWPSGRAAALRPDRAVRRRARGRQWRRRAFWHAALIAPPHPRSTRAPPKR